MQVEGQKIRKPHRAGRSKASLEEHWVRVRTRRSVRLRMLASGNAARWRGSRCRGSKRLKPGRGRGGVDSAAVRGGASGQMESKERRPRYRHIERCRGSGRQRPASCNEREGGAASEEAPGGRETRANPTRPLRSGTAVAAKRVTFLAADGRLWRRKTTRQGNGQPRGVGEQI